MNWLVGYHSTNGQHHDDTRATWAEAREVIVEELDQRVMAIEAEPSGAGDMEDELDELRAARALFAGLTDGDEGAFDANGLTFVLVPARTFTLRGLAEEGVPLGAVFAVR